MDYGKAKYQASQRAREARRKQAHSVLKEMKFRLRISSNDYETKKKHVIHFLENGDKVKVTIMFKRGRESNRPHLGARILERLSEDVEALAFVEAPPTKDGWNMTMILSPRRKNG